MRSLREGGKVLAGVVVIGLGLGSTASAMEQKLYGAFKKRAAITVGGEVQKSKVKGSIVFSTRGALPEDLTLEELSFFGNSIDLVLEGKPARSGVLSVRLLAASPLRFDAEGGFSADIEVALHYPQIDRVRGFTDTGHADGPQDAFDVLPDRMQGKLSGRFRRPLSSAPAEDARPRVAVEVQMATIDPALVPLRFFVRLRGPLRVPRDICACVGKRLCLQPIGVKSSATDPSPTGTAFATLLANADDIWGRVCVVFEVRPFMYVVNADWETMTYDPSPEDPASEQAALRASVDVDDCVEVFFIDSWTNPEDNGGGATWGSGMASAKIITSDAVDNGVDFHHLAHEIGHVLGLKHPGSGCPSALCPGLVDGSTGTVMCPSGFLNDNPDVQSEENGANASNPLATVVTSPICPLPDCIDSGDCGPC